MIPLSSRPQLGRTQVRHRHIGKTPGRRGRRCQRLTVAPLDLIIAINIRGLGCACRDPVPWPRQHANRHAVHDQPPVLPAMKLCEIISPHQPDKAHPGVIRLEAQNGFSGIPRSGAGFVVADGDARVPHDLFRRPHPARNGGRTTRFQGITGAHEPPDPIQIEPLQSLQRDMHMAAMRRIKRSPQQTHGHARLQMRYAFPDPRSHSRNKIAHPQIVQP